MSSMKDKVNGYEISIESQYIGSPYDEKENDYEIIISKEDIKDIVYYFMGTLEEAFSNAIGFTRGLDYSKEIIINNKKPS